MSINDRVKQVRLQVGYTQVKFGERIAVAQQHLTNIERGERAVTDRIIKIICFEFNISEEWLRYGTGEMFHPSETLSLDEYAKQNHLTALEYDLVKGYIQLDLETRKTVITHIKTVFDKHSRIDDTNNNN